MQRKLEGRGRTGQERASTAGEEGDTRRAVESQAGGGGLDAAVFASHSTCTVLEASEGVYSALSVALLCSMQKNSILVAQKFFVQSIQKPKGIE